jgi:hypothetical protein
MYGRTKYGCACPNHVGAVREPPEDEPLSYKPP